MCDLVELGLRSLRDLADLDSDHNYLSFKFLLQIQKTRCWLFMPRHPTTHVTEPKEWFSCLVACCPSKFRSINGRTQHIHAIHTRDEPQQDDFPVASEWPRVPSPQSETTDELDGQALNDFEPPGASSSGFDRVIHLPESDDTTYIQPQPEEWHSEFFSPSPPPFVHSNSPMPFQESSQTKDHPFINGKYVYFSSCNTY